jgi:hypothetical protein
MNSCDHLPYSAFPYLLTSSRDKSVKLTSTITGETIVSIPMAIESGVTKVKLLVSSF